MCYRRPPVSLRIQTRGPPKPAARSPSDSADGASLPRLPENRPAIFTGRQAAAAAEYSPHLPARSVVCSDGSQHPPSARVSTGSSRGAREQRARADRPSGARPSLPTVARASERRAGRNDPRASEGAAAGRARLRCGRGGPEGASRGRNTQRHEPPWSEERSESRDSDWGLSKPTRRGQPPRLPLTPRTDRA